VSVPFYSTIPPFTIVQGVWRFYSHLVLFGAVLVGIAHTPRMIRTARRITWAWAVGALVPALLVVFNLHAFHHADIGYGDPTEYRPVYSVARDDAVRVMKSHERDPQAMASLQTGEYLNLQLQADRSQILDANLSAPHRVTFHRFEWPAWKLFARDREVATQPDSIGRATALLPAGQYTARWELRRAPIERAGVWTAFFGWASLILAGAVYLVRRILPKRSL
jgi:hypothetical protein